MLRVLLLLLLAAAALRAEDLATVLARARAAEAKGAVAEALQHYEEADRLSPGDPFILRKLAKQLSDSSDTLTGGAERRKVLRRALDLAERSVQLAPKDPACAVAVAVCCGKLASAGSLTERVEFARRTRQFAEAALALDPNDVWAHHVLGRWHYELTQVGGPSRAVARLLYGGLPAGSCADAIVHLRKAAELDPHSPAHPAELGYALLICGDRSAAAEAFSRAVALPAGESYERREQARARFWLARLRQGDPVRP